jgi:hypothetical protein
MMTRAAMRTAARGSVLVGLLVGLTACGGDDRDAGEPSTEKRKAPSATASATPVPQHNVEVHLQGIRGSEGKLVAGVLFRAKDLTDIRDKSGVGGFGVRVDDDPFSFSAPINDGSTGFMPFLKGPLADVSPGPYTLLMWRGPTLGGYTKWVPAAEPGLTFCPVQFEVVGDDPGHHGDRHRVPRAAEAIGIGRDHAALSPMRAPSPADWPRPNRATRRSRRVRLGDRPG